MNTSEEHVLLVELFRDHPALAVWLAALSGRIALPPRFTLQVIDPMHNAARRAADVAVVVCDPDGVPQLSLSIEIQRSPDPEKEYTWPGLGWLERMRQRCDSHVLVVAPRRSVAIWARRFAAGRRGEPVQVLVFGPEDVPRITDLAAAHAHPDRAILSAVFHGHTRGGLPILRAAAVALADLPEGRMRLYSRLVFRGLDLAATLALLEADMLQQQPHYDEPLDCSGLDQAIRILAAPAIDRATADAEVRTRVDILLLLLKQRGLRVGPVARARIVACADTAVLDRWLARVLTVARVAELFEP